ncbi:MAG: YqaJ viral recombinase family protein [Pseudomonadota bacterium]
MKTGIALSQRTALRLASTKGMSRDQWLLMRKQGIGSSDAATAVGLNPYQSPLELWMIKTGREEHLPKIDPNDESHPTYWGHILEPIVAVHYTKRTGLKVRKTNAILQHPDPDKAWMLANIDYSIVGNPDVQILECKTAGEFGSRLWRDGPPEYVQVQVQHQMAVTGRQVVDVCVLLHGQRIEIYRIARDEEVIARLVELERHFWQYVVADTPPPADGSESAGKALQALYPFDCGGTLDLSEDRTFSESFADLVSVRAEIEARKELEAQLKQRLQERMGEASYARFATGTVSWKRNKAGSRRFVINP